MIGSRIKELRNNQKLTQEELADGIVSRTYLSLIEKGSVQPSNNVLVKLSERLGVNVNDLMVESKNYQYSDIDMSREIIFYENKIQNEEFDVIEQFIDNHYEDKEDIKKLDLSRIYLIYGEYYLNQSQYKLSKRYLDDAADILLKMPVNDYFIRYTNVISRYFVKNNDYDEALDVLERALVEMSYTNQFQLESIQNLYLMANIYFDKKQYYTVLRIIKRMEYLSRQVNITYKEDDVRYMKGICLYHEKKFDTLELITAHKTNVYDKVLYSYSLLAKGDVKSALDIYGTIEFTREFNALNEIIDELDERFKSII